MVPRIAVLARSANVLFVLLPTHSRPKKDREMMLSGQRHGDEHAGSRVSRHDPNVVPIHDGGDLGCPRVSNGRSSGPSQIASTTLTNRGKGWGKVWVSQAGIIVKHDRDGRCGCPRGGDPSFHPPHRPWPDLGWPGGVQGTNLPYARAPPTVVSARVGVQARPTLPPGCPTAFDLALRIFASAYVLTAITAPATDDASSRSVRSSSYA